jgi:hypothetical protein
MLAASEDHAAAVTDAEKERAVAVGDALLLQYEGTGFQLNYFLGGTVVPLVISSLMLKSAAFSRTPGYVGLVAAVMNLGLYVPSVGLYLSVLAGLALWFWYLLIAAALRRLEGSALGPER